MCRNASRCLGELNSYAFCLNFETAKKKNLSYGILPLTSSCWIISTIHFIRCHGWGFVVPFHLIGFPTFEVSTFGFVFLTWKTHASNHDFRFESKVVYVGTLIDDNVPVLPFLIGFIAFNKKMRVFGSICFEFSGTFG